MSWATASLLLVGALLRAHGYVFHVIPVWEDEAAWAMRLIELPLSEHVIRPLGFMALSKLLVTALGPSEAVLRAMPWLAGMASLAMAPLLAKRLFSSPAAQLIFVGCIALHPGAIDLAKEFKPYSVGLAYHMGLLLLTLRYLDTKNARELAALLALLFLGTLFSQDLLFTYPAYFGLLLLDAFRARRMRRLLAIGLAAAATLTLLVTLYVFAWSKAVGHGEKTADYWGKKYDVFYVPNAEPGTSRLGWTNARLGDMAAMPGMRRELWDTAKLPDAALTELKEADVDVWRVLVVLGIGVLLYRQRRREALLLLAPLACMVAFNGLGAWPLGAFRTNLFVLLYTAGLAAGAFERRSQELAARDLVPVGALVLAPFLMLAPSLHANKPSSMAGDSSFREAMQTLLTLQQGDGDEASRPMLVLDNASCAPWRYYTQFHPRRRRAVAISRHFVVECTKSLKGMVHALRHGLDHRKARAFVLLSRAHPMADVQEHLPRDLVIDSQVYVGGRNQLVVRVKKRR
jgi:hypothetical protein